MLVELGGRGVLTFRRHVETKRLLRRNVERELRDLETKLPR